MKPKSYNDQYFCLLSEVYRNGIDSINQRTGSVVRTLPGGISFKIDMSHGVPTLGHRFFSHKSMAAEFAWIVQGTKDPSVMMKYCPGLWKDFTDENGEIPAAYGYRLRSHFERDQLSELINHLKEDPSSRQTAIYFSDPNIDGLGNKNFKVPNIPCVTNAAFSIVDHKLHCSVFMRSTDLWLGLPFDIFFMSKISYYISRELGIELGTLHFTSANAHIYNNQYVYVEKCLKEYWYHEVSVSPFYLSDVNEFFEGKKTGFFDKISSDPEGYIEKFLHVNRYIQKHPWKPRVNPVK